MPTKYSEELANQYYKSGLLFPLCEYSNDKRKKELLVFYKNLAQQLTDDEIRAASEDAVSAARLVADELAEQLNTNKYRIVKYNTEPKPLAQIREQIAKAADTRNAQGYFEAFSDMACVQILVPNPRELP